MLTLKVENFDRLGDGGPLSFDADRRGFDLGRDQHLDWTLPDPSRKVSGKHCTILFEKGGYHLYDVSTNGTFVNGSSRRVQSPYELKDGDELAVGDYVISVAIRGESRQPAPPPSFASQASASQAAAPPLAHGASSPDVWGADSASVPPLRREELLPPQAQPARTADFLSAVAAPLPSPPPMPSPVPPLQRQAPAHDPWGAASVPPRPQEAPDTPSMDDWMLAAPPPAPSPPPPPAPPPQQQAMPVPNVVRDMPFPASRPQPAIPPRVPEEARRPPPQAPATGPSPDALRSQVNQDVLRRFAEGANIPSNLLGDRNAADLAYELGEIFKLVCANLMQLLKARAEMKSVVRTSGRTMIEARENNALKFTPSAEAALAIMFGQPAAGYLDPKATIERSFADLKLHETATFSAMQQALIQLLDDLSPDSIEQATAGGKLGFLSGKTKQWEMFCERWKAKAGASEHGLLDAFLDEFAAYYDAAIPRRRQ